MDTREACRIEWLEAIHPRREVARHLTAGVAPLQSSLEEASPDAASGVARERI